MWLSMEILPTQALVTLSWEKPSLHLHWKLPGELMQIWLLSQELASVLHSSMSAECLRIELKNTPYAQTLTNAFVKVMFEAFSTVDPILLGHNQLIY